MNTDKQPLTREQIQQAIALLPDEEYDQLTNWLTDHDFQRWDKQIENDLESGRLDKLTDELHQEYSDGKAQPLSVALSSAVPHQALPNNARLCCHSHTNYKTAQLGLYSERKVFDPAV